MTRYFLGFVLTILLTVPAAWSQGEPLVWVQIEAQPNLARAQASARRYGTDLQDVNGFSLGRGWYAIALGPYRREEAERVLQVYRNEGVIARDSYIAESSDFERQFWPVGANLLTRTEPAAPALPQTVTEIPEAQAVPEPIAPDETPSEARASERLLDRDGRAALQTALKWAGFYGGTIDAAFGRGTRASMGRWQDANGFEVTGILTTAQRTELLRQYNAVLEGLGLEVVRDNATGIAVKLPMAVVEFDRYEPPFAHFKPKGDIDARVLLISQEGDRDTLAGLYDIMQTLEIVPETGPRNLERDSFRLIGESAFQISHTEVWLRDGQLKGYTLIWPAGDEERRSRLLGQMQDSFEWLGGTLDPAAGNNAEQRIDLVSGLEVRKPKLSRSGFYVDQAGSVVTTSEVVQNCGRITIDDMYDATVTLDDSARGIALLRPEERLAPQIVATFQDLTPRLMSEVAVAGYSYGGILGAPTMTFGQLADLRGLNGEEYLKRLAINVLEGDAGGPVLDGGGAVLGMLLPHVQNGRALPDGVSFAANTGALRDILTQNGITPRLTAELGNMPAEALTERGGAMTVLVSCWE